MGFLTGALFIGWRRARARERRLDRQLDAAEAELRDLWAERFCCECCDWCGWCTPEDWCPDCG